MITRTFSKTTKHYKTMTVQKRSSYPKTLRESIYNYWLIVFILAGRSYSLDTFKRLQTKLIY